MAVVQITENCIKEIFGILSCIDFFIHFNIYMTLKSARYSHASRDSSTFGKLRGNVYNKECFNIHATMKSILVKLLCTTLQKIYSTTKVLL